MLISPSFVASQQLRLRETLAAQHGGALFRCAYGFVLYQRRLGPDGTGAEVFGIVTPEGESMPLTAGLVRDLALHRLRLRGNTQLALSVPPDHAGDDADTPLSALRIDFYRTHEPREPVSIGYVTRARDFRHATVVLAELQPGGWPG